MRTSLLSVLLLTAACSQSDLTGREITDIENAALDTCNDWLSEKMGGKLGAIQSEEAVFVKNGSDQIDIAWQARTSVGDGPVVCSTDGSGTYVRGALVDGIQVRHDVEHHFFT
jgi:hypothetical protein